LTTRPDAPGGLAPELARCFEGKTGVRVSLPALRAREADILLLAHHFWKELGGESVAPDDFAAKLAHRSWPGNVRELRIAVEDMSL
jgi:propionate catabolism operon transcriptional regulator